MFFSYKRAQMRWMACWQNRELIVMLWEWHKKKNYLLKLHPFGLHFCSSGVPLLFWLCFFAHSFLLMKFYVTDFIKNKKRGSHNHCHYIVPVGGRSLKFICAYFHPQMGDVKLHIKHCRMMNGWSLNVKKT